MKALFGCRARYFGLLIVSVGVVSLWNFTSLISYKWKITFNKYVKQDDVFVSVKLRNFWADHVSKASENIPALSDAEPNNAQRSLSLHINTTTLINNVKNRPECMKVAADPKSYWRSQFLNGGLNTSEIDIARMVTAFSCGILYPEFFTASAVSKIYPVEHFYLSEPPIFNIIYASDEKRSVVTLYNSSFEFKVGDTAAFKIEMRNGNGHTKKKGGDQIRVWFHDVENDAQMAAKVTDFNNGTYLASALLPWAGNLRLNVALAYPREYLRAVLYLHRVFKTFRPIAAVYNNTFASEAAPCYHTQVIPAFNSSELCDLTTANGAPWFCGHPIKSQLSCSDYAGTIVIGETLNYPFTHAEMETLKRSCRKPWTRYIPTNFTMTVLPVIGSQTSIGQTLPCNKISPKATWVQEIPTGYLSRGTWYPLFCQIPKEDNSNFFQNKEIAILGDSNGRSHYYQIQTESQCTEIKKALTKRWHKPMLCVHENNNFTLRWEPHTNPFMNGHELANVGSLVPSVKIIDEIPSEGHYLIILNHYFHLTTTHISATDFMYRFIKDALVRLFQRNPNVQVVLQGPYVAWFGWKEHYAAGDMFGTAIMDLQREIFDDIKDKVVFISSWDITIAAHNLDFHPGVNKNMYDVIKAFMCGR